MYLRWCNELVTVYSSGRSGQSHVLQSLCALVTEGKPFPKSSYAKNVVQKVAVC